MVNFTLLFGNMEMIRNTRGGAKVCYQGYKYTKKATYKTTIRWERGSRRAFMCNGSLTTDPEVK